MIKAILAIFTATPDKSNTPLFAFTWTDTRTNKQVSAKIVGGEANIRGIVSLMNLDWSEVYEYRDEMRIRDYKSMTKKMPNAGCTPDEIAAYVTKELGPIPSDELTWLRGLIAQLDHFADGVPIITEGPCFTFDGRKARVEPFSSTPTAIIKRDTGDELFDARMCYSTEAAALAANRQ